MKKAFFTIAMAVIGFVANAQNLQKGNYGYLYCHMSDRGEYTAYAISRDGYHYEDLNNGNAIFDPEVHARIEGGTRDAYITRKHDGKGYLMVEGMEQLWHRLVEEQGHGELGVCDFRLP